MKVMEDHFSSKFSVPLECILWLVFKNARQNMQIVYNPLRNGTMNGVPLVSAALSRIILIVHTMAFFLKELIMA